MKINIKIDKLILHNFTPQEQKHIQTMITNELTNTLKNEKNLFKNNNNPTQPLTYNVNTLKITTTVNPQKIGHEIARTIKTTAT